jgi:hypothetical protein
MLSLATLSPKVEGLLPRVDGAVLPFVPALL